MTTKTNLAPFKIGTRKGWIWIENSETGTRGPKFEASKINVGALRRQQAQLNTEITLSRLGF